MAEPLLSIRNLSVQFFTYQGVVRALEDIDLTIQRGEILGLVGETGCGKSVLARSILRLIPDPPGRITHGEIRFKGEDILQVKRKRLREIRGNEISMIFQEPMSSLNPVFTIGNQMAEVIILHQRVKRDRARDRKSVV
jgi:ABC-type dipeptide/oligopeptide/nickel transport system ATPase component